MSFLLELDVIVDLLVDTDTEVVHPGGGRAGAIHRHTVETAERHVIYQDSRVTIARFYQAGTTFYMLARIVIYNSVAYLIKQRFMTHFNAECLYVHSAIEYE